MDLREHTVPRPPSPSPPTDPHPWTSELSTTVHNAKVFSKFSLMKWTINIFHVHLYQARIRLPTLALKPRGDITRVWNRGTSGPKNGHVSNKFFLKKSITTHTSYSFVLTSHLKMNSHWLCEWYPFPTNFLVKKYIYKYINQRKQKQFHLYWTSSRYFFDTFVRLLLQSNDTLVKLHILSCHFKRKVILKYWTKLVSCVQLE